MEFFNTGQMLGLHCMRSVIFTLWIMVALFLASYFAEHYLLLVWHYGFWRVHRESLHFTFLPSSHSMDDYLVSNGDRIPKVDGFVAFPLAIVVSAVLIAVGYVILMRGFGGRKRADDA
jgi:hypothetical protein